MTKATGYIPYEPQLRPVIWATDIWTVDGPEVVYRLAGMKLPCPTRMTVVRLNDGSLLVHSPVECDPELVAAVTELGTVSAIIAPNVFHYTHLSAWADRFPEAAIYALPGIEKKVAIRSFRSLTEATPDEWSPDIDVHIADLASFAEAVFFHRPSQTLVVTDLMQNFEADRVRNPLVRFVLRAGGATGPDGRPSIEIRMAAIHRKTELRQTVRRMIEWQPRSIILSHGRCYQSNAQTEIERAFRWL